MSRTVAQTEPAVARVVLALLDECPSAVLASAGSVVGDANAYLREQPDGPDAAIHRQRRALVASFAVYLPADVRAGLGLLADHEGRGDDR